MRLSLNSREIVELDAGAISGRRGLGFVELSFELIARTSLFAYAQSGTSAAADLLKATISEFYAEVTLTGKADEGYLGVAQAPPTDRIRLATLTGKTRIHLKLKLGITEFDALESARNGGELDFSFDLHARIDHGPEPVDGRTHVPFNVSQKRWIDLLRQVRYTNIYLFELPLYQEPISLEWQNIKKGLDKAQHSHLRGEYDEVVAACRTVLEMIPQTFKAEDIAEDANKKYRGNSPDRMKMTKHEREVAFREALRNFCHLAVHADENAALASYTRGDASFVLAATLALLAKYTHQYA